MSVAAQQWEQRSTVHRQVADKRAARSGFERLTAQHPDQCDGWPGLAANGAVSREVLENAYARLARAVN
ncbi:hypothetical protein [Mycobacterium tilburgii]|uniref:hypothetical protein n=1 Tax=Mycobacterium tilburgii TaxID=44467 RepID=UPI002E0EF2B1